MTAATHYGVYKSEVTGLALGKTAAALSFNAEHKRKWQLFAQLEQNVMDRYLEWVQEHGEK